MTGLALATLGVLPVTAGHADDALPRGPIDNIHACDHLTAYGQGAWYPRYDHRGVTICIRYPSYGKQIVIQIIDLNAGAFVALKGEPNEDGYRDTPYVKRTADQWFNWLVDPDKNQNTRNPYGPDYSQETLLSVSNASFFTEIYPWQEETKLSLPSGLMYNADGAWRVAKVEDGAAHVTAHDGIADNTDAAWEHYKISVAINHPSQYCRLDYAPAGSGLSRVETHPFFTHYSIDDARDFLWVDPVPPTPLTTECHTFGDQFVGYYPQDTEGTERRTYFAVDNPAAANKIFILNSTTLLTGAQAEEYLHQAGAGTQLTAVVQLDGGGSTQLDVDWDSSGDGEYLIRSDDPLVYRKVPTVLAVYLGPVGGPLLPE